MRQPTAHPSGTFGPGSDPGVHRLGPGVVRILDPVMLPVPSAGRVDHLDESPAASFLGLGGDDVVALGEAGAAAWDDANRR
jgi:hypothetical protein